MTESPPETAEERRARKARMKAENGARLEAELERDFLQPLPETMGFNELQMEHGRLRMKIMEFQQMVIQGQLELAKSSELEKRMVAKIHEVEERARGGASGRHVPKPGEK